MKTIMLFALVLVVAAVVWYVWYKKPVEKFGGIFRIVPATPVKQTAPVAAPVAAPVSAPPASQALCINGTCLTEDELKKLKSKI